MRINKFLLTFFFQFTIVFGLAILSVANYGNTFEFSGLDPSQQSKFKSTPFSPLNIKVM
jgi:hypothetical protein